jgi:hypothetical protein
MPRNLLRWAGAGWFVCLVALSLQPVRLHGTTSGAGHLLFHLGLFLLGAVFPLLLSETLTQQVARALCIICLAGAIEIAQGRIYRVHTEWRDIAVDGAGVLIAFLAIRFRGIRRGMCETGN